MNRASARAFLGRVGGRLPGVEFLLAEFFRLGEGPLGVLLDLVDTVRRREANQVLVDQDKGVRLYLTALFEARTTPPPR